MHNNVKSFLYSVFKVRPIQVAMTENNKHVSVSNFQSSVRIANLLVIITICIQDMSYKHCFHCYYFLFTLEKYYVKTKPNFIFYFLL